MFNIIKIVHLHTYIATLIDISVIKHLTVFWKDPGSDLSKYHKFLFLDLISLEEKNSDFLDYYFFNLNFRNPIKGYLFEL